METRQPEPVSCFADLQEAAASAASCPACLRPCHGPQ